MNNKSLLFYNILGITSFYLTGFRFINHRAPLPLFLSVLYLIIGFFILTLIESKRIEKYIDRIPKHYSYCFVIIYIIFISLFINYSLEYYNLQKTIGLAPTANEAMILPAKSFLNNGLSQTYSVRLYDGAPISPGPGWILLNSFFSVTNLYYLMTPFWLLVYLLSVFFYFNRKFYPVIFTITLISSSLVFWSMAGAGYDLIALSLSIGFIYCLIKIFENKNSLFLFIIIGLFTGTVSTSRIIFILLPFIFSLAIKNKLHSLLFFSFSILSFLSWHIIFFVHSTDYQPFHLFQRGLYKVGYSLITIGIILSIITGFIAIILFLKNKKLVIYGTRIDLLLFTIPCFIISFGELYTIHFDFANWEGANYLIPVWGIFIIILLEERNTLFAKIKIIESNKIIKILNNKKKHLTKLIKSVMICLPFIILIYYYYSKSFKSYPPDTFTIWQLPAQTKSQMMSYVIRTINGKIIVIDGGTGGDAEYLKKFINRHSNQVEMWFITHPHYDHCDALVEIINKYSKKINIKTIFASLPDKWWIQNYCNDWEITTYTNLQKTLNITRIPVKNLFLGEELICDGLIIKILGIKNPEIIKNPLNNSSLVLKIYDTKKSFLFLADLGKEGGNKLIKSRFKNDLHADYVQMAHHGNDGVSEAVYDSIKPNYCLWPTPIWLWENDSGNGKNSGSWNTQEVYEWMKKLNIKKHYFLFDGLHKIQ